MKSELPSRPEVRLVSPREAARLTSLSKSTLWRLSRAGSFPRAISLSPGRIAWRLSDVENWIATRGQIAEAR
jgi:prophage regulatory protein